MSWKNRTLPSSNEATMTIRVPASSANLGPGFDSIGLAVNRYLHLDVWPSEEWLFTSSSPHLEGIPSGKTNMVYNVARAFAATKELALPPCHVDMRSDIPLARGLGSSAAAIIAAIELADQLVHMNATREEKLRFASILEGHPDNVGACLYGGLTIGMHTEKSTKMVTQPSPNVDLVLMVPSVELLTKEAREVLPETLPYRQSIEGSACGNVLVAALLTGDFALAGELMNRDRFHQPYRTGVVPGLTEALDDVLNYGVYGAALSGAGPTILCLAPSGEGEAIAKRIQEDYPDYEVSAAKPCDHGSFVSISPTVALTS
ncbi:homoserine kinase [Geomicrobium sp. JCM 19038]|uniref:homoserine kinase n=1 Tax=Geomicrobium sp. JCM 19038 TaxID=1460635 RepID=UPI00045F175B|nr:homoserine kinase [Geomicrobium sp. JCM 19038]GAK08550.1 homoserine kinase [Geomicrobium sp. JCM 19038]